MSGVNFPASSSVFVDSTQSSQKSGKAKEVSAVSQSQKQEQAKPSVQSASTAASAVPKPVAPSNEDAQALASSVAAAKPIAKEKVDASLGSDKAVQQAQPQQLVQTANFHKFPTELTIDGTKYQCKGDSLSYYPNGDITSKDPHVTLDANFFTKGNARYGEFHVSFPLKSAGANASFYYNSDGDWKRADNRRGIRSDAHAEFDQIKNTKYKQSDDLAKGFATQIQPHIYGPAPQPKPVVK